MTKKKFQRKVYLMNHGYYRPKMYKSGKNWLVVGMTILSLMGGASMAQKFDAHADNINNKLNNQSNQQNDTNTNVKNPTVNNIQSQANNLHNRIMNNNSAYQNSGIVNNDEAKNFVPQNTQERINKSNSDNNQNSNTASINNSNNSNRLNSNSSLNQPSTLSKNSGVTNQNVYSSKASKKNKSNNINSQDSKNDKLSDVDSKKSNKNTVNNSDNNDIRYTMSHKNVRKQDTKRNISKNTNKGKNKISNMNRSKASHAKDIMKKAKLNPVTLGHGNLHQRITANKKRFTAYQKPYIVQDDGNKYPYNSHTSRNFNGKYSDLVSQKQARQIKKSNKQNSDKVSLMKIAPANEIYLGEFNKQSRAKMQKIMASDMPEVGSDESTYRGLHYKYNADKNSVEFTSGTADSDLSNFLLNAPNSILQAKSIYFDDNINTSNVTNMSHMFDESDSVLPTFLEPSHNLQSLNLGKNFDTSNVTNMSHMFKELFTLRLLNLGKKFNTKKVTNMSGMFAADTSLQSLNLGNNFDTSNVTNMSDMFDGIGADSLNLGSKFNTKKVTNMSDMFSGAGDLQSLNLGKNFDTSNVTNMSNMFSMFDYDSSLKSLNLGDKFNTKKVTNMEMMFNNEQNLQSLSLGKNFDTSNVTDMDNMFNSDKKLHKLTIKSSKTNLSLVVASNTSNMDIPLNMYKELTTNGSYSDGTNVKKDSNGNPYTLYSPNDFGQGNIGTFITNQNYIKRQYSDIYHNSDQMTVPIYYSDLYSDNAPTYAPSDWKFVKDRQGTPSSSAVSDRNGNFLIAPEYKGLVYDYNKSNNSVTFTNGRADSDLSDFILNAPSDIKRANAIKFGNNIDTSNVTNMRGMFEYLDNNPLKSLNLGSNFDTSNVTNMSDMFDNTLLQTLTLPDSFDTSNVTNMSHMFSENSKLQLIHFNYNFNTSNVTDMSYMFSGACDLQSLNLGKKFNTKKVTNMGGMFGADASLKSLELPNAFNTTNTSTMCMFNNVPLQKLILDGTQATFSDKSNLPHMYKETGGSNANGSYTESNPHDFTKGEAGIYITQKNVKQNNYVDIYNHSDNFSLPHSNNNDASTIPPTSSDGIEWTFVDKNGNPISKEQPTNNTIYIAPIYRGLTYDYNSNKKSITFEKGTLYKNIRRNYPFLGNLSHISYSPNGLPLSQISSVSFSSDVNIKDTDHSLQNMFLGNPYLKLIDTSKLDTSHIRNMSHMFCSDAQLTTINTPTNFQDTSDLSYLFANNPQLTTINHEEDTGDGLVTLAKDFATQNVTNMSGMFMNDYKLSTNEINSLNFDTTKVTNMSHMFQSDKNVNTLVLYNFNTNHVKEMRAMFQGDSSLYLLLVSPTFTTSNVSDMSNMFKGVTGAWSSLVQQNIFATNVLSKNTKYNSSAELPTMYAIDNNVINPQHPTLKDMMNFKNKYGMKNKTDSHGVPYTSSNPNDFSKGNIGIFITLRNPIEHHYVDIYNNSDQMNVPKLNSDNTPSSAPYGWKFVKDRQGTPTSDAVSDGNGNYLIAPAYKGLVYDYNKRNNSVTFTNGKADSNLSNFMTGLGVPSEIKNAKSVTFGNNINTSNVTNMGLMFDGDNNLQILNLSNSFNTSNVTNMDNMFSLTSNLQSLTLPDSFNTSNVQNMAAMFLGDSNLQLLNLGNNFITNNVTTTSGMFAGDNSLKTIDLGNNFDTSNVNEMASMFADDSNLQSLNLGNKFNTKNVSDISSMFANDPLLTSSDAQSFINKMPISPQENSNISAKYLNMLELFHNDKNITQLEFNPKQLIGTNDSDAFSGTSLHLLKLDNNNITFDKKSGLPTMYKETGGSDINGPYTESDAHDFTKGETGTYITKKNIKQYSYVDIYNATDKFQAPKKVNISDDNKVPANTNGIQWTFVSDENGDVSKKPHFDSQHRIMIAPIFYDLTYKYHPSDNSIEFTNGTAQSSLKSFTSQLPQIISMPSSLTFDNSINTSNVTDMSSMFYGAGNLKSINFGNNFNTSNVTNMSDMFTDDKALTNLNVSSFNTQNVSAMNGMFESDTSLNNIKGLDNFNTSNVNNYSYMFANDYVLPSIDLSGFKSQNNDIDFMFKNDKNISQLEFPALFHNIYSWDTFGGMSKLDLIRLDGNQTMFSNNSNLPHMYKETGGGNQNGPYTEGHTHDFTKGEVGTYITKRNVPYTKFKVVYMRDNRPMYTIGTSDQYKLKIENGNAYTVDGNGNATNNEVVDSPINDYDLLKSDAPILNNYSFLSENPKSDTFYVTTPPIKLHIRVDGYDSDLTPAQKINLSNDNTNGNAIGRIHISSVADDSSDNSFNAESYYNRIKGQWNSDYVIDVKATNKKNGHIQMPNGDSSDNINHVYFPSANSNPNYYLELTPIDYNSNNIQIEYDSPGNYSKAISNFHSPSFDIRQSNNSNLLRASDIINNKSITGLPQDSRVIRTSDSDGSDIGNSPLKFNQQYTIHITTPSIYVHYINGRRDTTGIVSQDENGNLPTALSSSSTINTNNSNNGLSNLSSNVAQSILHGKYKNDEAKSVRVINGTNNQSVDSLRIHYVTSNNPYYADSHQIMQKDIQLKDGNQESFSNIINGDSNQQDIPTELFNSDGRTLQRVNSDLVVSDINNNTLKKELNDPSNWYSPSDNSDTSITINRPVINLYVKERHLNNKHELVNIHNVNQKAKTSDSNSTNILSPTTSHAINWDNEPHNVYIYLLNNNARNHQQHEVKGAVVARYYRDYNNNRNGSNVSPYADLIKQIPLNVKGNLGSHSSLAQYLNNAKANILTQLDNGSLKGFNTRNFISDGSLNRNNNISLDQLESDANNNQPLTLNFLVSPQTVTVKYYTGSANNAYNSTVSTVQFHGINDESDITVTLPKSDIGSRSNQYPTNAAGLAGSDTTDGQTYYVPTSDFDGSNVYSIQYGNYINPKNNTPLDFYSPSDNCFFIQVKPLSDKSGGFSNDDINGTTSDASIPTATIQKGQEMMMENNRQLRANNRKSKKRHTRNVKKLIGKSKYLYINAHKRK